MVPLSVKIPLIIGATAALLTSAPIHFTYYTPELSPIISLLEPRYGPVSGGADIIRVHGTNFVPILPTSELVCQWGLKPAGPATFVSSSLVLCSAPPHPAGEARVAVSFSGESGIPLDLGIEPYVTSPQRFGEFTLTMSQRITRALMRVRRRTATWWSTEGVETTAAVLLRLRCLQRHINNGNRAS